MNRSKKTIYTTEDTGKIAAALKEAGYKLRWHDPMYGETPYYVIEPYPKNNYRVGMLVQKRPEFPQPQEWQIEGILDGGRIHLRSLPQDRIVAAEEMDAIFMVMGEANFKLGGNE